MHFAGWYLDFRILVPPLFEQEFVHQKIWQEQKEPIREAGTDSLAFPQSSWENPKHRGHSSWGIEGHSSWTMINASTLLNTRWKRFYIVVIMNLDCPSVWSLCFCGLRSLLSTESQLVHRGSPSTLQKRWMSFSCFPLLLGYAFPSDPFPFSSIRSLSSNTS